MNLSCLDRQVPVKMTTPGSDIDIAVISDDFSGKDIFDRALMTKDAEIRTVRKFRIPLDVVTLTTEEYHDDRVLFSRSVRKGIVLPA